MDNNNPEATDAIRPLPPHPETSDQNSPPAATTPPLFPYAERAEPPVSAPPRTGRRWLPPILGGLAGAAILALVLWSTGQLGADDGPREIREVVTDSSPTVASAVARKVVPSIVTVDVGTTASGQFQLEGSGSGVVISSDGLIATNDHVVNSAEDYQVIFSDGRTYEATMVGSDRRTDLAVLQINATGLTPIELGSSDEAVIGQTAIAIGSPLGLDGGPSVTVGVVSAFGRQVRTGPAAADILFGMLQTDAPITQGSSGGALVDANGRLLGITSAIGVSSAGAEGIGFAIPVELVTRITEELIERGSVSHPFIGVQLDFAFTENSDGSSTPAGAYVADFAITPSAAADAGVQRDDLITAYDGNPVFIPDDLISGLRTYRAGDEVTLSITRGSDELEVLVILGVRPDDI